MSQETNLRRPPMLRRGRLSGTQRNRLGSLLNMMYTTPELAEEIGITPRQIRQVYIPLGCPHERSKRNHIMINGVRFRTWYLNSYIPVKLSNDEAFCISCRRPVKMINPIPQKAVGVEYWICNCPKCGRRLARIYKRAWGNS